MIVSLAWRNIWRQPIRTALSMVGMAFISMLLVFMLCLTSFAVVLTLGGGPKSTTLEVAIYQSLRFDFEPTRAVVLALLQLCLCLLVAGPCLLKRSKTTPKKDGNKFCNQAIIQLS